MPQSLDAWLDRIGRQHPQSIALGLERVGEVAARLGLGRPARRVVTVGGTNGKGSTVAFVEAIARAAGHRVGAYTSPHLLRYNERVRIDGADVGDADLVAAFEAVEAARGDTPLTYFEYGTLAALWLFERAELDLAVLEVGLGGRLDAVNLVDPDVAVITTVDLDHAEWLGEDREAVGAEKAGIIRAWKPVVLGERDPPSSVLRRAYALGASAIRAQCDFFVDSDPDGGWRWREPGYEVALPDPALAAPVQRENAAAAIAALRALDLALPDAALAAGLRAAVVPGRLQCVRHGDATFVLDVAHNPQAARELARWLAASADQGAVRAVFAALADKDIAGILAPLAGQVVRWHLAGLGGDTPRGLDAASLRARKVGVLPADAVETAPDVATALAAARATAAPGERILVFGSFYTVAAALHALEAEVPSR
ncbi:bifunctional tetrahydrofolate synthase/dihydrofolate synthase [Coralloluteibacterium thermophilus]|uniref:Dihydrofolate synthase/folylpolyglutamate synthase n=1 Tax=Coralloluteibacterium thermophilum TaxID=2707049 RepID=A0ABV9NS07_9GAMM